ncbi:MFS transporter [Muribaculum intestinale]|uniref:MFS transporter n=1 Tax=Muribaculum intestinale TaxID=1796646 RepID=UPI0024311709|nr:MFS transporter [Muribaculum intestinale]
MIANNGREITSVSLGRRAISAVYRGARLVWQALRDCIAGGWWQHGHGWSRGTGWCRSRRQQQP